MPEQFSDDDTGSGAPPPPGERKAVELWAEAKGLWPQFHAPPALAVPHGTPPGALGTVPVDMRAVRAPAANPEFWKFAAARAMGGWPQGKELTEAEFDSAIATASGQVAR